MINNFFKTESGDLYGESKILITKFGSILLTPDERRNSLLHINRSN